MLHNKHRCSPVNMRKDCSQSLTHSIASKHSVCAKPRQDPPPNQASSGLARCAVHSLSGGCCARAQPPD